MALPFSFWPQASESRRIGTGRNLQRPVEAVEILHNPEAAAVYIEVYVPRLKIGRKGFPHLDFGVQPLHRAPRCLPDSFVVVTGQYEEQPQLALFSAPADFQDDTADYLPVEENAVRLPFGLLNFTIDGAAGDDLAILLELCVAYAELLKHPVAERLLIVENELLPVRLLKRYEFYIHIFHNVPLFEHPTVSLPSLPFPCRR